MLQGLVFFQEEDVVLKQLLCRWTVAFSRTLMCHLRENGDVQKQLQARTAAAPTHDGTGPGASWHLLCTPQALP